MISVDHFSISCFTKVSIKDDQLMWMLPHLSASGRFWLEGVRYVCMTKEYTKTILWCTSELTQMMGLGWLHNSMLFCGLRTGGMICGRNDSSRTISGRYWTVPLVCQFFVSLLKQFHFKHQIPWWSHVSSCSNHTCLERPGKGARTRKCQRALWCNPHSKWAHFFWILCTR